MLWNLIRDFFVVHIFGGTTSIGDEFDAHFGNIIEFVDGSFDDSYFGGCLNIGYKIGNNGYADQYLYIGDYLSSTATMISIVIILVLCCLFIKKMVSTISNLMSR